MPKWLLSVGTGDIVLNAVLVFVAVEVVLLMLVLLVRAIRGKRPLIRYLPQDVSFEGIGNEKDPPAIIVRHLHLVNDGPDTVLSDWGASIILPGAEERDIDVMGLNEWLDLSKHYQLPEPVVTRNATLTVRQATPVKATLMLVARHAALGDMRLGANVRVSCQDGSGKRWPLEEPMNTRLAAL